MKKLALLLFLSVCVISAYGQNPSGAYGPSSGGGSGTTPQQAISSIVTTGLMADYQMLPTETPGALVDYSGNGNNATGTAGVAPTMIAGTGGVQCNRNGGITLPPALNTAVTIQMLIGYQPSGLANALYAPIIGNGTPATSGVGIVVGQGTLQGFAAPSLLSNNLGSLVNDFGAGTLSLYDYTPSYIAGIQDVAIVLGASSNQMYNNGLPATAVQTAGGLNKMLTGAFQLCGAAAGVGSTLTTYWQGQLYPTLIYRTAKTPAEIYQNHIALLNRMQNRGLQPITPYRNDNVNTLVVYGDSTSAGSGFTPWTTRVVGLGNFSLINRGISGFTSTQMLANVSQVMNSTCSTAGGNSGVLYLTGANDTVAATVFGNLRGFSSSRQFPLCATANMIASTMMDFGTGSSDAYKNATNLLIRTNCRTFAAYCIDLGGTAALGADGAANSAACFQGDHLHPVDVCVVNVMTWVYQRGINRFYGNHSLTTATTYASAATAAVAVTAATETGNTMTFTTAANTFAAGDCVPVTGVTPTGYNSTTVNGAPLGCWYVLTAPNNTTFTAFNAATGLGALSVAGTASDPQQKDADQTEILNFGAGNHTLQPCDGLTPDDTTVIVNINAAASTLVPFGSQTITGAGAAPTTLAANTTAILQAKLVSPAAGGCNWIRLQ